MRIEDIDLDDEYFIDCLKKFLVESQPYKGFSPDMSKQYLDDSVKHFIKKDLSHSDIKTCFISGKEEVLFFLFCTKNHKSNRLEIIFPFPNLKVINYQSWSRWPFAFCHLMLDQLNKSGFDEAYGEIQRKNRKSNYEKALIRFGHKMFEIIDVEGDLFNKKVIVRKENLIKAHEKIGRLYKDG